MMNTQQIEDISLTNLEIHRYFSGVYAFDQTPQIIRFPSSMIINLDPSYLQGSHWVSLCINADGVGFYMDSFGRIPTNIDIIRQYCTKWRFNNRQIQPISSLLCGEYCLYFIYWWSRGRSGCDILNDFCSDLYYNDQLVNTFCKTIFPSQYLFINSVNM